MRQFLLAGGGAYPSSLPLTAGQVAFTALINGVETIDSDGTKIENIFYLNLKKAAGDTVVLPGYKRHFSYTKGVYEAGSAYTANVTITAPASDGHYTLILVKKGLKFNERNRWTATVPVKIGDAANAIAAKLGKFFEANATNLNITVQVVEAKITITGKTKGEDFKLIGADDLTGIAVSETAAKAAYGDAEYIKDLANKAAADAGFLYTYEDLDINPAYPLNPLAQGDKADTGYTIFTLRFAVPRNVKTRDELVHQIVQVAFPTGAGAITEFEAVCEALISDVVIG